MVARIETADLPIGKRSDRRNSTRTCLQLQADVTLPGDLTIVGHTMDISPGGISLEVPYMLQDGQECLVELDLSALGGPAWAQLTAQVRHCAATQEGSFRAGLQFKDLDPTLAPVLDGLL